MNAITEFVKAIGAGRVAAMGAVAVGLIGFFIFLMMRFSQPHMSVLFTNLAFEDSAAVVKELEAMNVPHEMRQDGAIILVPKENVLKVRMKLAEDGLPAGGRVGYEIFDKTDTLGATSFVQNINQLRAIEGELARTISSLKQVQTARVHLVMPQRQLFARKKAHPSASIVVKVRGTLSGGQIQAIQHLVASAVEGLTPERISLVDERGKLLASGKGDDPSSLAASNINDKNKAFQIRLQNEIEEIVGSVVGPDRVRVRVAAELDFNKITQTSEVYDPDGQVVRATNTRTENSTSAVTNNDGTVSVGNELPAADDQGDKAGKTNEATNTSEELVNYEISKTTKTEVIAAGRVKKISVAVLVDGQYETDANGKVTYTARSPDDLKQIENLVRSAIGFDKVRGDQIYVANLRFADRENVAAQSLGEPSLFDFSKDDLFYIAELVVTLLVSLLVLLFVVRPLVRRIISPDEIGKTILTREIEVDPETGEPLQITGPDGEIVADNGEVREESEPLPPSKASVMLESAKISGEIQASAIREVGEIVENNPEEAVGIIRDWLDRDAA